MRLLLALLFLAAVAAWAQDGYPSYKLGFVTGDEVHLRAAPGKDAPVVANLRRGDPVGVVERKGGWTSVFPRQVYVRKNALDAERRVKEDGATLLWEPRADAPVLGPVSPGVELWGVPGDGEYVRVLAPATPLYYVADQYVAIDAVPVRPSEIVDVRRFRLAAADVARLRKLGDLRMVALPIDPPSPPRLVSCQTGRFGPGYEVKYQLGSQWFKISVATSGEGGPDVRDVLYTFHTPLLGRVIVGPMDYGGSNDLMSSAPRLEGGKLGSISVNFWGSPQLPESVVRQALMSLRAARL